MRLPAWAVAVTASLTLSGTPFRDNLGTGHESIAGLAEAVVLTTTYTFCDTSVPDGMRVSSGTFSFAQRSPTGASDCLATVPSDDPNTPRIDVDGVEYTDFDATLTFYQKTHFRDLQLCGRTQGEEGATYKGLVGGANPGFDHPDDGYCCYLDTKTSTSSLISIKKAGLVMKDGTGTETTTSLSSPSENWHELTLSLSGTSIGCTISNDAGNVVASMSTVDSTSAPYSSGGVAFAPYDGVSGHHFKSLELEMNAPTPQPTAPSPQPTSLYQDCSASTCDELGWTNAADTGKPGVCGESDAAPLSGCSGEMTWLEARAFCQTAGTRLCTLDEVKLEPAGTGCVYDAVQAWSSTVCGVDM